MTESREARFQQGIFDAIAPHGWKADTAGRYVRGVVGSIDVSKLELIHYRLIKRVEKSLDLEEVELTPISEVALGKPQGVEKQRLAENIDRLRGEWLR